LSKETILYDLLPTGRILRGTSTLVLPETDEPLAKLTLIVLMWRIG